MLRVVDEKVGVEVDPEAVEVVGVDPVNIKYVARKLLLSLLCNVCETLYANKCTCSLHLSNMEGI